MHRVWHGRLTPSFAALAAQVSTLLEHRSQEVVKAALSFVKVRPRPTRTRSAHCPRTVHLPLGGALPTLCATLCARRVLAQARAPTPPLAARAAQVGLSALPPHAVGPLLPRIVPPMLVWATNKHPHLKTQVRDPTERLKPSADPKAALTSHLTCLPTKRTSPYIRCAT